MTAGLATFPSRRIPLVDVRRDGGTQVRETMNAATVEEYATALREGEVFPPVTVFFDGAVYWLADGFHRALAHEKARHADILAEVRDGTLDDALWFALAANGRRGLSMSQEDKRKAIRIALEKWPEKTSRGIARHIGVSHTTVADVRSEMECGGGQTGHLRTPKEGIDGKLYGTPGDAANKVRAFFADHPEAAEQSDRAVATAVGVDGKTVAKVRRELTPVTRSPAQPTRHPLLDELDAARDRDALDRAYSKVAVANLSGDAAEEAGRIYQRRGAELRAQAAATVAPTPAAPPSQPAPISTPAPSQPKQADLFADAPVHVSTQAPTPQPEKAAVVEPVPADTVTIPRAEYDAMKAELTAYRAWVAVVEQRSVALAPTIKGAANLERIRRLIELAGSPSENEARNAAALACRMIREQGVKMLTSDPSILDDINATNRLLLETARKMGIEL